MSQESFAAVPSRPIDRLYRRYVLALKDIVDSVGLGVASGRCGLRPQDLNDMLEGHKGRRMPSDVAALVADMVTGDLRKAYVDALKEMNGLVEPESDADYIRRLEDGYSKFGEVGRMELGRHKREARR